MLIAGHYIILGIVLKGCLNGRCEKKSLMPVLSAVTDWAQAGGHPSRRFPLLGTGNPLDENWTNAMVVSPGSISLLMAPPPLVSAKR